MGDAVLQWLGSVIPVEQVGVVLHVSSLSFTPKFHSPIIGCFSSPTLLSCCQPPCMLWHLPCGLPLLGHVLHSPPP